MAATRKPSKNDAAAIAKRVERVRSLRDRLAAFEAGVVDGQIAEITSRLSGYSPRNALLIAMQLPAATHVAGYRAWQADGRQVRKGEKAIEIFAPRGSSAKSEPDAAPKDGKPAEAPHMFFSVASVFDISQTDVIIKVAE